jgi:hypothetical protein
MSEIKLFGGAVETGKLTVDTGEFGSEVCLTFSSGAGPSQFTFKAVLSVADAESLQGMIGQAADEANERISEMAEEADAIIRPPPPQPEEGASEGFKYALHLEHGKPPMVIEFEDIPF